MTGLYSNYVLTKKIFEKNSAKISADRLTSSYPESHKALFYFQKKIDSLLSKIEPSTEPSESNYYFNQVVTRVIVEHFIVGHYIWTKTRIEQNDNCGVEYYAYYRLSELLKRENYDLGIEGIEKNIKNHATLENLQNRFSDYPKPFTQADIDDTHRLGNQFEIKSIFNYVVNKIPNNDHFIQFHVMLSDFLRLYNRLSSFIHGGPCAENETYHGEPKVNKAKTIEDNIAYGQIASRVLKEHIMMLFFQEKPEYFKMLEPIMDLKNKK